jgi:hypothetical protein
VFWHVVEGCVPDMQLQVADAAQHCRGGRWQVLHPADEAQQHSSCCGCVLLHGRMLCGRTGGPQGDWQQVTGITRHWHHQVLRWW